MKKQTLNLGFIFFLGLFSCIAQKKIQNADSYEEDLSVVRNLLEANPSIIKYTPLMDSLTGESITSTVNDKVDALIDSISMLHQQKKYMMGYTIQIYSGQNKQQALASKAKLIMDINNKKNNYFNAEVRYNQPNFLVTTGQYCSKLEAQKDLLTIKPVFLKAILVPKQIPLDQLYKE